MLITLLISLALGAATDISFQYNDGQDKVVTHYLEFSQNVNGSLHMTYTWEGTTLARRNMEDQLTETKSIDDNSGRRNLAVTYGMHPHIICILPDSNGDIRKEGMGFSIDFHADSNFAWVTQIHTPRKKEWTLIAAPEQGWHYGSGNTVRACGSRPDP